MSGSLTISRLSCGSGGQKFAFRIMFTIAGVFNCGGLRTRIFGTEFALLTSAGRAVLICVQSMNARKQPRRDASIACRPRIAVNIAKLPDLLTR
jgi:hypothetical protein